MSSGIEINVLGDLQVLRDGAAVDLPPSRKTRALLAYLAVLGRPQRRERLCEMFWELPDDPRGALRWSLSKIRGILNTDTASGIFTADRNVVAISPEVITTDFSKVRTLARSGVDTLALDDLKTVAAAFRGAFLDDLSLPRCPEFEAWRVSHVNDMELLRLRVLRRLVAETRGEPEAALRFAQDLQRLLPEDRKLSQLVAELAEAARRLTVESALRVEAGVAPAAADPVEALETEIRYCTTRDGARVAYAMTGSGPPIVRAAHWMSHLRYDAQSPVWRHWIRALSAENTLLRYDERGNGMSQWDVDDLGFDAMVADLESIVDASGFERVVLLGISQGCAISVAYAVRHPERVAGLVLYGGYVKGWRARGDPEEIALRQAMETLMLRGWGKDDPIFRQIFTALFIPGASREQIDWFNELQRTTVTPENAFRLSESFADIDVSDLLSRVRVPTLVIHGRDDRVSPFSSGEAFAAGIPGATFVELDSGNHILLEEEPAFTTFVGHLRRFVGEVFAAAPAAAVGLATRRPVSIFVAELIPRLVGFAASDPEAVGEALDPLAEAVVGLVRDHGGLVIDRRDGVVTAAFGADRAFEEHTVQAARAARAVRDMVTSRGGAASGIRIGIDAGEALIRGQPGGAEPAAVSGPVVRRASRLAATLARDAIALTGRARESAGGYIATSRLSRSDIPGLAEDETAYELIGENRALSRWYLRARQGLTPLVGRGGELSRLADAWQRAREGQGRVVSIVGSPGVGKSRLVHEFIGMQTFKAFTIVEAGAEEITETVSHDLVKRLLLSLFGLTGEEDADVVGRAVECRFDELSMDAGFMTPVLYALDQPVRDPLWHDMQGADRARQVREAAVLLVLRVSQAKPIVLLVEDLHWADAQSRRMLEDLAQALPTWRILLMLTCRPGFEPAWSGLTSFEEVRLAPLAATEGRALATTLLGPDPSLARLHDLVCERAEGVPLFIEEIVGELVQAGRIGGKPGGMRMLSPIQALDIPATIHSVLAARIDKIDADDRKLLQIASVIGASAPSGLLAAVSGFGAALEPALARLKAADILFDSRSDGEAEYVFKHALIKDATYASLTAADRQALHAETLTALERLNPEGRTDRAERLAYHAVRARDWPRASHYLVAAADRAIERSSYSTAADFLEQAIEAVDHLPATADNRALAIDIRTRLRVAYMVTGQFDKAIERLDEAQRLAREAGDASRLGYALLHASYVYSTWGRTPEALAAAGEAHGIRLAVGDDRHAAEADLAAAQAHMIVGAARPAIKLLLPHIADFTRRWADDRLGFLITRSVWFLGSLASARALLGETAEAEADIAEALRLAEATGRPIDRYSAAYSESLVRIVVGCSPAYLDRLKHLAAESLERAPFPFHPWLTATLGHAALTLGRREDAVAALEAAFDAAEQANMPHFMTYASVMLAIAQARPGDAESREDLVDALRSARGSTDKWIEFEVLMALAGLEEGEAAERLYGEALEVAEANGFAVFADRARRAIAAARPDAAGDGMAGGSPLNRHAERLRPRLA